MKSITTALLKRFYGKLSNIFAKEKEFEVMKKLSKRTLDNLFSASSTSEEDGVTIWERDGYYALDGTATADLEISLGHAPTQIGETYKLIGINPTDTTPCKLVINDEVYDTGEGCVFVADSYITEVTLVADEGTVFESTDIRPMITTNIYATYNDWVSFTGYGSLSQVIARIPKDTILTENSIANNLTTTSEGYPLDATQGKILYDMFGTTKDYTSDITTTSNVWRKWDGTKLVKYLHLAIFSINITVYEYNSKEVVLGTIPDDMIPIAGTIEFNTVSNNGSPCYLHIRNNEISLEKTSESSWEANDGIRTCVTYLV